MPKPRQRKPQKVWMLAPPGTGGVPIPPRIQEQTRARIENYAAEHFAGKYTRLDIRFRTHFCYIDAFTAPPPYVQIPGYPETEDELRERMANIPTHLCRLRYHGSDDRWEMAFYKYSDEKYELCILDNGSFYGTPEEGFDSAAQAYLE